MEDYSCMKEGTIIIPILQVNKVRPREDKKKFTQGQFHSK